MKVAVETVDSQLLADWASLADEVGARFFSTPEWFTSWAKAFNQGHLEALTVRNEGRLLGVLPVVPDGKVLRSATNNETKRFQPLFAESVDLATVVAGLPAEWRRLSLACLPQRVLPSEDRVFRLGNRKVVTQTLRRSPFLETVGDFEEWERSRFSSSRLKLVRRRKRQLAEFGEVAYEVVDGKQRLQELLAEVFALEASGWKGSTGTAISSRPEVHGFYTDYLPKVAAAGKLRLFFLRLDGVAIACTLAIQDRDALSALKIGFNEEFRKVSPGRLLTRATLEYCFDDDEITRLDFHGEAEEAKLEWTDDAETEVRAEILSPGVIPSAEGLAIDGMWRARDIVRSKVPVEMRERVDTSSIPAAAKSLAHLARTHWIRTSTPPASKVDSADEG